MTGSEYQKLAMRTSVFMKGPGPIATESMLNHAVFELNAEAGEVSGIMQKTYQGHKFDQEHMMKELGDCLWGIAEACQAMGVTMDDVMQMNIDKLRARYPDGFEEEKSLNRKDNDI